MCHDPDRDVGQEVRAGPHVQASRRLSARQGCSGFHFADQYPRDERPDPDRNRHDDGYAPPS
jgi:hypothetical protein